MKNYLYIINPISGKGRGKKARPIIAEYCDENNIDYTIIETQYPLHAKEIVEQESENYSYIVSVGGDGTLNEIINGIKKWDNLILAVLPVGSGNDFTKNLGMDSAIKDNLSIIHDNAKSEVIKVDVGNVIFSDTNGTQKKEYKFINNLGIGFDAYVGYLNQKNKIFSGIFSYIFSVIRALFKYKMIDIELNSESEKIKGERLMISIGNGISSGGGFYLNPHAKINDGLLDLSVFDSITRRRLLTALPLALMNKLDKIPEAKQFVTKKVELILKTPYYAHCDGEIISDKLNFAEVTIDKQILRVIKKLGN